MSRIRPREGFALIVVLWALLLLGALAAAFSLSMRTGAEAARYGLDEERAYFQAYSGIQRTMALLSTLPADNVFALEIRAASEDAGYEVALEGESGKINVNLVQPGLLLEILLNGGLTKEEAERLRDAIVEWRSPKAAPDQAPAADYAGLREPLTPRYGPFRSVEELKSVAGVAPGLYRSFLSRVFTVFGNGPVDVNRASETVLRAVPGMTEEAVAAIVETRREAPIRDAAKLAGLLGQGGNGVPSQALAMLTAAAGSTAVTVTAAGRSGPVVRPVRCLVSVEGTGKGSVQIVRWIDKAEMDGEAR
ncbi:MAG: hypothetical protein WBN64_12140 [Candidatus Deferrimicrobium sp.]